MTVKYLGDGGFIGMPVPVPPRDLTDDEYKSFKKYIDANEAATGVALYAKPGESKKESATSTDSEK